MVCARSRDAEPRSVRPALAHRKRRPLRAGVLPMRSPPHRVSHTTLCSVFFFFAFFAVAPFFCFIVVSVGVRGRERRDFGRETGARELRLAPNLRLWVVPAMMCI